MSITAMKQALEALESCDWNDGYMGENQYFDDDKVDNAITSLRQAIEQAEKQGQWGASSVTKPEYVAEQKEKTQRALDLMAENARELGLDYEPVQAEKQEPVVTGKGLRRLHDEMEPLATMEDEEQVSAWWKHFAGKVRLELKRNTSQPQQAQKPVVTKISANGSFLHPAWKSVPIGTPLYTTSQPQRERVIFSTMLRKMWSGGEVQAWLDENVNKEKNT